MIKKLKKDQKLPKMNKKTIKKDQKSPKMNKK